MSEDRIRKGWMNRIVVLGCALALMAGVGLGLPGCEEEQGPMEEAGETMDEAGEDAGEGVEDATED